MDALERSARTITAREEASGTSVVDDEAVGRDPTTAPAPLRVPRAMGGGRAVAALTAASTETVSPG